MEIIYSLRAIEDINYWKRSVNIENNILEIETARGHY